MVASVPRMEQRLVRSQVRAAGSGRFPPLLPTGLRARSPCGYRRRGASRTQDSCSWAKDTQNLIVQSRAQLLESPARVQGTPRSFQNTPTPIDHSSLELYPRERVQDRRILPGNRGFTIALHGFTIALHAGIFNVGAASTPAKV